MVFDPELESFKTSIDLRVYAAAQGYSLDQKQSCRGSAVMRHANGDKIIIKLDGRDGHFVYFSVRDDGDNGTIIDFVARRMQLTLGAIRKELRPWLQPSSRPLPAFTPMVKTAKDRGRVEAEFAKTTVALRQPYLVEQRGIPASLLESPRFIGQVRVDQRGNVAFPHFDETGISGMELRNFRHKGFSPGGVKALWSSNVFPEDNYLLLCESGIECLSHAVLFPDERTRYVSVAGKLNASVQPELIRVAAARMPVGSKIVAAMNADAAGRDLGAAVKQAVERSGRRDLFFESQEPSGAKDWNDVLRSARRSPSPCRHGEPSLT